MRLCKMGRFCAFLHVFARFCAFYPAKFKWPAKRHNFAQICAKMCKKTLLCNTPFSHTPLCVSQSFESPQNTCIDVSDALAENPEKHPNVSQNLCESKQCPEHCVWRIGRRESPDKVRKAQRMVSGGYCKVGNERSAQSFLASSFSKSGTSRPKSRDVPATPCLEHQKKATCIEFLPGMSRHLGP